MAIAARDPRTPLAAKLLAALVVAYALSPIDLVPDFIPVLGHLDDLVLVPLGIWAVMKLVPPEVMAEARVKAAEQGKPGKRWQGAVIVAAIWIAAAWLTWLWLFPHT